MVDEKQDVRVDSTSHEQSWSQVRETVRMLFLAVAQIEVAVGDSDDSVNRLTDAFTTMMSYEQQIAQAAQALDDSGENKAVALEIQEKAALVSNEIQSAVVAFQFYDKLSQRLAHVSSSLESLSDLLNDQGRLHDLQSWQTLQSQIRSRYSMREEHELFDSVMSGGDIREAVRRYHQSHQDQPEDDIELF